MNLLSKRVRLISHGWRNNRFLPAETRGVIISGAAESVMPLTERAMPESEPADTGADGGASEQVVVASTLVDDEHSTAEQSLFSSGPAVESEPVDGIIAAMTIPEPVIGDAIADVPIPKMVTTEVAVRSVLLDEYQSYWSTDDAGIFERVVELLAGPAIQDDLLAETAGKVRAALWKSHHASGGPSAAATCSIFHALGREAELGWVAREAYLYAMGL